MQGRCGLCGMDVWDWDGHQGGPGHRARLNDGQFMDYARLLSGLDAIAPGGYEAERGNLRGLMAERGRQLDAEGKGTAA